MSGRKKVILGNLKTHLTVKQAVSYAQKLAQKESMPEVIVGIAPHTLALSQVSEVLSQSSIRAVAQNAYFQDEGAYTGEISMPMLRGIARYVLIGHSERRHVFHESNELIRAKVAAAVRSGITPVLCIGETLIEREHFHTNQVIHDQLTVGMANLTAEEISKIIIAYEPVWAIGSGKFAHPEDVAKLVTKIRRDIASLYGVEPANKVKILYGGSVTKENAIAYLQTEGVDGLLVGGASLSLSTFWPIVESADSLVSVQTKLDKKGVL
ncbi:triose-phosphate isomerase [Candidatus Saccharibacteria bacterium]|nr:triose-phosphate isomerase [Candidatus Saccharibacteria bacterium]